METSKNHLLSTEPELRDDYLVSEKMKKVWKIELDIAQEVKRICEKYNIKYFIIWGTLLGAVRHKGFIPWDDDFDIGFFREDYKRFCEVAKKEIKSPYFVQDALSDSQFFIGYTRIRHSKSTAWILENSNPNYNNGVYIDVYVFDVLVKTKFIRKIQFNFIRQLVNMAVNYNRAPKTVCEKIYNRLVPYSLIVRLHEIACSFFNFVRIAECVGPMYSPSEIEQGYWFKKTDIEKTVNLEFEGIQFKAPKGYNNILTNVYGNYMKLPPRGKRGVWHENQVIFEPDMPYDVFFDKYFARRQ